MESSRDRDTSIHHSPHFMSDDIVERGNEGMHSSHLDTASDSNDENTRAVCPCKTCHLRDDAKVMLDDEIPYTFSL